MRHRHFALVPSILFLCLLVLSSCKKEADFNAETEFITTGSWVITTVISEPPFILSDGTSISDVQTLETDCAKDDTRSFSTDGTYFVSDESSDCTWNEPIYESGLWRFTSVDGERRIEYNYNNQGIIESYQLQSISSKEMVLVFKRNSGRVETITYDNTVN